MRAVNLIPQESRRATAGGLLAASTPTRVLIAGLLAALAIVAAHGMLARGVADRRQQLAQVEADVAAVQTASAALQPYGDVAAARERALATVRSLAATRYDWPRLLADVARRTPADVTLATLAGTVGETSGAAAPAPSATGAAAAPGPTIDLGGCTGDHRAVARMLDAMRGVPGVLDVSLTSSSTAGDAGEATGCPRPGAFRLRLLLAPAATTPETLR